MVRRIRPLLLLAICVILVVVGASYYLQTNLQRSQAPPVPESLPPNTSASANDWVWSKTVGSRPVVEVRAANFKQVRDPSRFDLERVELRLFATDGKRYDRVKSARAQFDTAQGVLYSDGEVEITMGVPADDSSHGRLVFIRTSGVTYDSRTGRAFTDRAAAFTFDQGEGKAVGASYDPATRELQMRSQAEVTWRGQGPHPRPMKVEAGELLYKERESVILLSPWSRLTRDDMVLEAGRALVWLKEGAIDHVEANEAHGSDRHPGRLVEYAAGSLLMRFSDHGEIEKINGDRNARLESTSGAARTRVTADHVEMEFGTASEESQLSKVLTRGQSEVEVKPLAPRGGRLPETRLLRSDVIELEMQPGGREIRSVETHTPGSIEFLPNRPDQSRRRLDAERMWIMYGPGNQIRSFRAANVSTRTDYPSAPGRKPPPPALTWSKDLKAAFDPATGELARLEQWEDFRYEEGDRKGRAHGAILEQPRGLITLTRAARMWDPTGSISADNIVLDQKSGDMRAEGSVNSTREPDRKKKTSTVFAGDEPLNAKAGRMTTSDNRRVVRYEGDAVLWQGGDRIEADWIEIDRGKRVLVARGHVISQFAEKRGEGARAKTRPSPVFTIVQADEMTYEDESRVAHYQGGVKLIRPATQVKASELRAYLAQKESGTELEKAYADGSVEILNSSPERTRKGAAEHAEYYAGEQKVILYGGGPVLEDSLRGTTRGTRLTWFVNDDRLLVDGREGRPAVSRIIRK